MLKGCLSSPPNCCEVRTPQVERNGAVGEPLILFVCWVERRVGNLGEAVTVGFYACRSGLQIMAIDVLVICDERVL